MKKKMVVLRSLLIVFILSISLLGCGKKDVEVADVPEVETETESVQEEPTVEEEATVEEQPAEDVETEETTETDTQEPTTMVDWETFAAQADNEDICLVVSNETTKTQKILGLNEEEKDPVGGAFIYQIQEGDKFAVPIRENIVKIWIDDQEQSFSRDASYFEIEVPNEEICQVYITTYGAEESKHFVLQK